MGNWGVVFWLVGLSAISFFTVAWLLDISNRQRQLHAQLDQRHVAEGGPDLSEPLNNLADRLDANDEQTQQLQDELHRLKDSLPLSIQGVSLVRFQAFSDYGGDQSFALALANAAGDGVVLSGIFAREGSRMYAKPLSAWTSSYSLSFEEEEAIRQAQSQVRTGEENS